MGDPDVVAGVMQDVVGTELDRLKVRRQQLIIGITELPEQVVLGPCRHASCLCQAENRLQLEPYVSGAKTTVSKCTQRFGGDRKVVDGDRLGAA